MLALFSWKDWIGLNWIRLSGEVAIGGSDTKYLKFSQRLSSRVKESLLTPSWWSSVLFGCKILTVARPVVVLRWRSRPDVYNTIERRRAYDAHIYKLPNWSIPVIEIPRFSS